MITSLEIEGYRGFSRFEMANLGRINLLVGKNNSGKTSVLEALDLLEAEGDPYALWSTLDRRGERVRLETASTRQLLSIPEYELEVNHLFHGHNLRAGSFFSILVKNQRAGRSLKCTVIEDMERQDSSSQKIKTSSESGNIVLALALDPTHNERSQVISLSRRGTLKYNLFDGVQGRQRGPDDQEVGLSQFVTTESVGHDKLASMWNSIALTDAQERVVEALRFIDDRVQQIAPLVVSPSYSSSTRGGFLVRLSDRREPVPIGSLGDGMWRILALAISVSRAKDSILLVDEIDTGLHYSVMSQMWRLIYDAATALDVQVFATTHSYDCVYSLASICDPESPDITIQRLEAGRKSAVHYSAGEIKKAAEMHIEMR